MNTKRKVDILCALLIVGLLATTWSITANASGPDVVQSNDPITNQIVGGAGSSYGLGMGSIDVAINQCVASEGWGLLVFQKQKIVPNNWCIGSSLYQMGEYMAAALVLCKKTILGELYPPGKCIPDLSSPPGRAQPPPPAAVVQVEQQHQMAETVHAEQLEEQQVLIAEMSAKIEQLDATRRASIRNYNAAKRSDQAYAKTMLADLEEYQQ